MKNMIIRIAAIATLSFTYAQENKTILLSPPDTTRGLPVMKALAIRASATEFDPVPLRDQDLSDLLWAADGINRPAIGKRTAPSALNAQDIDIYLCREDGMYLYDAKKHALTMVVAGDQRPLIAGRHPRPRHRLFACWYRIFRDFLSEAIR